MALEDLTGTKYIDSLNSSNPVGSTDPVSELDDHVKGIKNVLKLSFPGVSGAVTSTHTELNYVDITTLGTAQASKALTADSNIDVTGLRNLTGTGYLKAAQFAVGTTSPERELHLKESDATAYNTDFSQTYNAIKLENDDTTTGSAVGIEFLVGTDKEVGITAIAEGAGIGAMSRGTRTGGARLERERLTGAGDIGLGTTTPQARYEIEDNATSQGRLLKVTADDANPYAAVFGNDTFSTDDDDGIAFQVSNAGIGSILARGASAILRLGTEADPDALSIANNGGVIDGSTTSQGTNTLNYTQLYEAGVRVMVGAGAYQIIRDFRDSQAITTTPTEFIGSGSAAEEIFALAIPSGASTLHYVCRGFGNTASPNCQMRLTHSAHDGTATVLGSATPVTSTEATLDVADEAGTTINVTIEVYTPSSTNTFTLQSITMWFE